MNSLGSVLLALCMAISLLACTVQSVIAAPTYLDRPVSPPDNSRSRGSSANSGNEDEPGTDPIIFKENFSNNVSGWWLGITADNTGSIEARIAQGNLHLLVKNIEPMARYIDVPGLQLQNFLLTVELQIEKSTGDYAVAYIGFRKQNSGDFYALMISNAGTYSFALFQKGSWQMLQNWTPSETIQLTNSHLINVGVQAVDNSFTILIDNQELVTVADPSFMLDGTGGLMLGVEASANAESAINFDNLVIATLPGNIAAVPKNQLDAQATKRIGDKENRVSYLVPANWQAMPSPDSESGVVVVNAKASDNSAVLLLNIAIQEIESAKELSDFLKEMEQSGEENLDLSCRRREEFSYKKNGFSGIYSVRSNCNSKSDHLVSLIARSLDHPDLLLVIGGYFSDGDWKPVFDQAIRSLRIDEDLLSNSSAMGAVAPLIVNRLNLREVPVANFLI